ncbi:alpha/beta fold hydrolase [Nocardioides sp. Root151]|uniref:alpha/beta fold hydrolase n=1 Tax=Nocardioides sp. Root151 TaxID=1736475 RepID=UPI000703A970|nr:alpha/beta hydrolase [Nocardioides sp. Root151]KQZ75337.1 alpha/beta hydrolase [Nocardioides sp. Root151]
MSVRRRVLQVAAGVAGVAAAGTVAGTAVRVVRQRRIIARRGVGDALELGSLHSAPVTVIADDGVPLHVEVDEYTAPEGARRAGELADDDLTVVFVHGYALTLDCWHFQRAGYRGLVRAVYYDQRSHGRSGRSSSKNATIEQLAQDLREVLDQVVPHGRVVLVGHSMGGMSIVALAEVHPELFGDRIAGVALISTTAGGLSPHRIVLPMVPRGVAGLMTTRLIAGLARGARVVDGVRRLGKDFAIVATDRFAFGSDVPGEYVTFVDSMLSGTPFEVLAEFFPSFDALDKFAVLNALERVPTTIICGTADKLTSIGHSRKMHSLLPHSRLVEFDGAGHMVIMERHVEVNAALDDLLAAALEHEREQPS